MNVHKNARLTPRGRERIVLQVESGQTPEAVAQAVGVCPRTVRKWVDRYRGEGLAGLHDRSSRPHRLRQPTPQAVVEEIEQLRRQRWTGKQITAETGVSSPRFYVRRDVPMLQQIPPSFFSSGRRISSGSSNGSTDVGLADPSGQQTLFVLFNPFKPNNPAIQKLATG